MVRSIPVRRQEYSGARGNLRKDLIIVIWDFFNIGWI